MTSTQLVPVFTGSIQNIQTQLCNAQELHHYLEVETKFADWISRRISDYGFIENEDYITLQVRTGGRGRSRIEYHITLDMGKELGMVERNEKGRQIRKHFIEIEKRAKAQKQLALPDTITPEEQQQIQKAVQVAHHRTKMHYAEIYARIKSQFKIAKYDQLPRFRLQEALDFINGLQPIKEPLLDYPLVYPLALIYYYGARFHGEMMKYREEDSPTWNLLNRESRVMQRVKLAIAMLADELPDPVHQADILDFLKD